MNFGMSGRFANISKHKVVMENGKPKLNSRGEQVPIRSVENIDGFDNQITLSGLDAFATTNPIRYLYLSTNSNEALSSDTSLVGAVAYSFADSSFAGKHIDTVSMKGWIEIAYSATFPAGVGTGNITKLGSGWSETSTNPLIWSSALVKDVDGNNTVITKLEDEVLNLSYILRVSFNLTDTIGSVNISGVNYTTTTRPESVNNWKFTMLQDFFSSLNFEFSDELIVPATSSLPGVLIRDLATKKPYVMGSYQYEYTFFVPVTKYNFTEGIKSLVLLLSNNLTFQVGFAHNTTGAGIPKTAQDTLSMGTFTFSWGIADATST